MLCAVSSVAVAQTVEALERSCRSIRFGDAVFFCDVDPGLAPSSPVRWQPIAPLRSKEAYSHFLIKELGRHATCSHILVTQWDGYVLDPARWDDDFLRHDYIGATWPQFDDGMTVGNGGFSLRSRRLHQILGKPEFAPLHPEDTVICRTWRRTLEDEHGIVFAPPDVANRFSAERMGDIGQSFGFHGLFNMPDVMPVTEMRAMVEAMPPGLLHNRDGADFILRLAERGHHRLAWRYLARRLATSRSNIKQLRLLKALIRIGIRGISASIHKTARA